MKLSAFIQNNTEAIIQEFEQFARSILPKTGGLDQTALRDHARLMLENIVVDIDSLESKSRQAEKSKGQNLKSAITTIAHEHGKDRVHLGFDITSMVAEYRFLRATIIRLWSEHSSLEALDNYDLIRLNEALDQLICEAVDSFSAETKRQARRFDTVLSSSSDNGYILDLEGKFVYANKPMLQIFNRSLDELVGKSHFDFNFSAASEIDRNIRQVIQSAENCSGEVKYTLPTGEERQYEYVFSPVLDDQKKVEAVAATERDITDRNRATEALQKSEKQLLAMNDELEVRVELRTHDLQETQKLYMHAEKLSAIGKLSASIAHEFNNPLQGILSILKGVQKRAILEKEDRELVGLAISDSNRMKDLIRSLQDFNRPSSGKQVMMDVHVVLNSLLLMHKSDFAGRRISVALDYAENLPHIMAISDQIKQVLLNLLANAADACEKHDCVITVSTWREDDMVAVAIKDTGIGIKPENIEHIFHPFYTTKAEVKGTGLGLSVSYGIIKKHHGEIRVVSKPGEGATFTVLLPIKGTEESAFATDK